MSKDWTVQDRILQQICEVEANLCVCVCVCVYALLSCRYSTYTSHFKENDAMRQTYEPLLIKVGFSTGNEGTAHLSSFCTL
jgi:hypothetical protein